MPILSRLRQTDTADQARLQQLRENALEKLKKLAKEDVELTVGSEEDVDDFLGMRITEKKRVIKKVISNKLDAKLKEYIKGLNQMNLETAYDDFIKWIQ